jgi:hypothetical protein
VYYNNINGLKKTLQSPLFQNRSEILVFDIKTKRRVYDMALSKTVKLATAMEWGKEKLEDFFNSPTMVKAKAKGKKLVKSIMSLDFQDVYNRAKDFFTEVQKTDTYKKFEAKAEEIHNTLQENLSVDALTGKTESVVGDYVGQLIGVNQNPKRPLPYMDTSQSGDHSYEMGE